MGFRSGMKRHRRVLACLLGGFAAHVPAGALLGYLAYSLVAEPTLYGGGFFLIFCSPICGFAYGLVGFIAGSQWYEGLRRRALAISVAGAVALFSVVAYLTWFAGQP